jgi:Trypsin
MRWRHASFYPFYYWCSLHPGEELRYALKVKVNRHDLRKFAWQEDGTEYTVAKVINHPDYSSKTMADDNAVWKLNKKPSTSHIKINMDDGQFTQSAQRLMIAVWGRPAFSRRSSAISRKRRLKSLTARHAGFPTSIQK